MGNNNSNIEKIMFETFKQRLQYDSLDFHVILYSTDRVYEYNYKDRRIRPFTSIIWFDLNNDKYSDFIYYFNEKINQAAREFEETGYMSESISNGIGYYDNGYIVVDIDSVKNEILNNGHKRKIDIVEKSFDKFFEFISHLYDKNKKCFEEIITNNFSKI